MSNVVSSTIFAVRNVDKFENGDLGRLPVAGAQTINIFDKVLHYNARLAKGTDGAIQAFNALAEHNKFLDYTGKTIKWAAHNVNPLICASGGLKVLMSDDKPKAAVEETTALATMFAGEKLMKTAVLDAVMDSKPVNAALEGLKNGKLSKPWMEVISKHNAGGKISALARGVMFVGASIASYAAGQNIGDDVYSRVSAAFGGKAENINLKS